MLTDRLKEIVGSTGWTTDPDTLAPYLLERRGNLRGKALIMVMPETTEQVSRVVAACAESGTALVPQGGNTSLCAGAIPDDSGKQVLLSLSRLSAIRSIDPDDFSIVVEAGCILANVQEAAMEVDRIFPLSLSAEGSCQIGGNLATNAGGINVLRYGTARQQVLGLEVVLADGTIWNGLRSLRKDTAGYDMKQVFIGSEGTLGIITAASLKMYPNPGNTTTAWVAMESAQHAVQLLARVRENLSDQVLAFELMSDRALRFVRRHISDVTLPFGDDYPWHVLLDVAIADRQEILEEILGAAIEEGVAVDAIIAKSSKEAEKFWRIRHSISDAQRPEGANLKHDISVPISQIGTFLTRGQALLESTMPEARLVAFGHVGDGNLHYNIAQPAGADASEFLAAGTELSAAIYKLVDDLDGSFSAEHGVGVSKKALLALYRGSAEIELMRTLKRALDPQNILNPGKVI
jgi:FAD/FMN-containing dehydrogenase